mmetsp:Transcript_93858/g.201522  ORF Transcript_93858/g.201522 Transcript_93858/m.201522 type:complete len:350 (+) Transcript_93858:68-1117(+)|eukprot:CAMPEP_0180456008 /NCGR_PEP_ID=MMETSP1036_2-20121128/21084_1 /TAXON_ID=632150 /ORGANISM="Azadinium spinosum, Strain 3D9" /LENGTH=349 /DNA_ID=CAMNT_0022462569 /DNA_START=69 /DNA_END=1118 /DNA_ORIENTATION=+
MAWVVLLATALCVYGAAAAPAAPQRQPASLLQALSHLDRTAGEAEALTAHDEHPTYGFFLPCWRNGKATINVVSTVRHFYPSAPIFLVGNGYYNYTKLCQKYACDYVEDRALKPRKSSRGLYLGTPERKAYFSQLKKACEASTYLILLEDDVRMLSAIKNMPPGDAGGIADTFFRDNYFKGLIPKSTFAKIEALGRMRREGFHLDYRNGFQLAGGSYMRCSSFLDALQWQPAVDVWEDLDKEDGGLHGSDAVLYELMSMGGYEVKLWQEAGTVLQSFNKSTVTFVHGDKSLYGKELSKEEASLVDKIASDWERPSDSVPEDLDEILANRLAHWRERDTLMAEKLRTARR